MIVVLDASIKNFENVRYVQSAHVLQSIFLKAQNLNKILVPERP